MIPPPRHLHPYGALVRRRRSWFAFQLRGATPRHGPTYRNGYATRRARGPQGVGIAVIPERIHALLQPEPGGTAAAVAVPAWRMVIRTVRPGAKSVGHTAIRCFDRKSVRFQHIADDPGGCKPEASNMPPMAAAAPAHATDS